MSLKEFISEVQKSGFTMSKPFLFEVVILGNGATGQGAAGLKFMCHEANLPSWNVASVPNRIYGYTTEMPADYELGPVTFSFYVDRNLGIAKILEESRKKMFNTTNYSLKFRQDYEFPVQIAIFDVDQRTKVATYTLNNCFFKNIRAGNLSWAATDQIQNINVEIGYDNFEVVFHTLTSHPFKKSPKSFLDKILDSKYYKGTAIDNIRATMDQVAGIYDSIPSINFDTVRELMPEAVDVFKVSTDEQHIDP
jgi:hypothetical protein